MAEFDQVAHQIVGVALCIGTRAREIGAARRRAPDRFAGWGIRLTPGGGRQPVKRIVDEHSIQRVGAQRRIEKAAAGSAIADGRDISREIAAIGEVLEGPARRSPGEGVRLGEPFAAQPTEQHRLRVIGMAGHDAIAVSDENSLALRVVSDPIGKDLIIESDPFEGAGTVMVDLEKLALSLDVLGISNALHAIERVIAGGRPIDGLVQQSADVGLQRNAGRWLPIHAKAWHVGGSLEGRQDDFIRDDSSRLLDWIALEVAYLERMQAGFIEMPNGATQHVRGGGFALRHAGVGTIPINDQLAQTERLS